MMCRSVKKICKTFNLTDELASVLESLRMEVKSLTSPSARVAADTNIKDLSDFIASLSEAHGKGDVKPSMLLVLHSNLCSDMNCKRVTDVPDTVSTEGSSFKICCVGQDCIAACQASHDWSRALADQKTPELHLHEASVCLLCMLQSPLTTKR